MRPFLVAGEHVTSGETREVKNPYSGEVVDEISVASWGDVEKALGAADQAFESTRKQSAYDRSKVLLAAAGAIRMRAEELTRLIVAEGGKPYKNAKVEVARAASTLTWAGEEAKRFTGELIRLDTEEAARGRLGVVRKFPLGPVLGIAPFNFPLNLVCHKVGPALAAGNSIVVKPASATPLSGIALGEILVEAGAAEAISVLTCSSQDAERAAQDDRIAKISFTGSTDVGWKLKGLVPRKKVTLELGGNAAVIVEPDADLDHAAERVAYGGFYQAGQSCISVQRVLIAKDVYDDFCDRLVPRVESLVVGDPNNEDTDVGPLIDSDALDRVDQWVQEALSGGAKALCGAKREDPCFLPTVLADVRPGMKVSCNEIFGPVVTVQPYASFDEALRIANETEYGLQAGVFTNDVQKAFLAQREIRVGGVIHNDVSAFRADQMPYGGVKSSGYGREGLRYAMDEMSETRILVLGDIDL
ncbi:MAG TPA: aldehyde dehydrogenase family protein [Actinomycetota bacterium]|nr:aldehyde dehydrogenase family protein [Actinomycetota bacterium]